MGDVEHTQIFVFSFNPFLFLIFFNSSFFLFVCFFKMLIFPNVLLCPFNVFYVAYL